MFLEMMRTRRSIRQFAPHPVEPQQVALLLEAALRCPSSRGLNPWEFVVVTDPGLLAALSRVKPHGADFLAGAPLGIVVCADPQRCDVWVEDASIAALVLHLAAHSLGLGSCWIQVRQRQSADGQPCGRQVAALLELPERLEVEAMLAIGSPAQSKRPRPASGLPWNKIWLNRFGSAYPTPPLD
jgi:nitroreductase